MVEDGKEYNPESATHLRPKDFSFETCGETFRYTLQIPEYVLRRLDSAALDQLYDHMHRYATEVVVEAIRGGYLLTEEGRSRMKTDVGLHLKNFIWERFSIAQERAGNDCWQVAPSLQRVIA